MIHSVFIIFLNLLLLTVGGIGNAQTSTIEEDTPIIIDSVNYGDRTEFNRKVFKTVLQNAIGTNLTYALPNDKYKSFNDLFGDPRKGTKKSLNISYRGTDRSPIVVSVPEGSKVLLSAGIAIRIKSVMYGGVTNYGGKFFNHLLQGAVGASSAYTLPNDTYKKFNDLFGDPKKGTQKTLQISYCGPDGVDKTISAVEGQTLTLSAGTVVATSIGGSLAQGLWRLNADSRIEFNRGDGWRVVPATDSDTQFFAQIVDTYMGPFYALSKTKKDVYGNYACYYRAGVTTSNMMGTSWVYSNGHLAKIVLAGDYLWGVNTAGIYYLASYSTGWVRVEGPVGVSINPTVIGVIGRAVTVIDSTGKVWVRVGDGIGTSWKAVSETTAMTTPVTPTAPVGAVAQGNWFLDTAGYIWFNKGTAASPNWILASDASGNTQFFTQIVDTYMGNFYALSKTQKDEYGNYACYYRDGVTASNLMGTKWTFSNGNLAKIVLAGDYLWGVNTAGIYYLSFVSGLAVWNRVEGPSGVSINPTAIDVITHSVAVTDSTGKVWVRVGGGIGTSWVQGNWRLDESGYIWFNKGTSASPNWVNASDASGDTQFFTQIVDTYMGNFYALSKTRKDAYGNYACYYREGVSSSNLMGTKWTFTNGNLGKIVLAGYYLWGVNTAGIYYLSFVSGKAVWNRVEGPSGVSINPKVIDVIGSSVAVTDSTGKVWVRTGDGIGTSWLCIGATTATTTDTTVQESWPIEVNHVVLGCTSFYADKTFVNVIQKVVNALSYNKAGTVVSCSVTENLGDPFPNVLKLLIIKYHDATGKIVISATRDGVTPVLSGVAPLTIDEAIFGATTTTVTGVSGTLSTVMQSLVGNNSSYSATYSSLVTSFGAPVTVGNSLASGTPTTIGVVYTVGGVQQLASITSGQTLTLSAGTGSTGITETPIIIDSVTYIPSTTGQVYTSGVNGDYKTLLQKEVGSSTSYSMPNSKYSYLYELIGDPAVGVTKTYTIKYHGYDGVVQTVTGADLQAFTLNAGSALGGTTKVTTNPPTGFELEGGSAVAVACGCNASGEPAAYTIGEDGKIYSYDSHTFDENPWVIMTDKTAVSDSDIITKFLLLSASSAGNNLVAVRENGKVVEYDFGDVTTVSSTTATTAAADTTSSTAVSTASSTATIRSASVSRRAAARAALATRVAARKKKTAATTTTTSATTTATAVTTTTTTPVTTTTTTVSATKGKWVELSGTLSNIIDIAVGDDKYLVAVGGDEKGIYQHNGTAWVKITVTPEAKGATGVAIGKDGVIFALNEKGTPLEVKNGRWSEVFAPVKFVKICAGDKDHVVAIAEDSSLWMRNSQSGKFEMVKDKDGKDSSRGWKSAAINAYGMVFLCDISNKIYHNEEAGAPTTTTTATTTVTTATAATTTAVTAVSSASARRASRTSVLKARATKARTSAASTGTTAAASTSSTSSTTSTSLAARKAALRSTSTTRRVR